MTAKAGSTNHKQNIFPFLCAANYLVFNHHPTTAVVVCLRSVQLPSQLSVPYCSSPFSCATCSALIKWAPIQSICIDFSQSPHVLAKLRWNGCTATAKLSLHVRQVNFSSRAILAVAAATTRLCKGDHSWMSRVSVCITALHRAQ